MSNFSAVFLLFTALPAFSQTPPSPDNAEPSSTVDSGQPQNERNRSVLEVQPGSEAIKNKDLYDRTGYLHPFRRMPGFVLYEQKKIWTSPFHTSAKDAKWWAIFGGATVGLVAADRHISRAAPDNSTLRTLGTDTSYLGDPYTLIPIAAGFYFIGTAKGNDHFREAGLLSFETLVDVTIVELALKSITNRERPLTGSGNGHFFTSASPRYNSSFPSGHAIETFAMASIFAHEYPHKLWVQVLAYSYAGGVVGARMAANKHFPGDVMAGGALGWFIGDYVYGRRHNPALGEKRTVSDKLLDHIHLGGPARPTQLDSPELVRSTELAREPLNTATR